MRVCLFGIYDHSYSRTRVLTEGFKRNGWEVEECWADSRGRGKYVRLFFAGLRVRRRSPDLVIVCFPGQSVMPLARLVFGRRVIFDALLSVYDANVFDRKIHPPGSFGAWRDWLLDYLGCRLAWKVLLDTDAHIRYFHDTFGVPVAKCIRVPVSADETVFVPTRVPEGDPPIVHFHGTFIPLQGVEHILEAAALMKDERVRFVLIGSGQEFSSMRSRAERLELHSVEFLGKLPVEEIPAHMARAAVVLGIFSEGPKASRVIPNKVCEAMAMGKAIITADTVAVRELPGSADAMLLVKPADPAALAEAIRALVRDPERRSKLGAAALALFREVYLPERIVQALIEVVA